MKRVEVTWLDAMRGEGDALDAKLGIERRSVGWLVQDEDDGVVIAMSRDGGKEFERWFGIPRPYIVKVRRLK